MPQKTHKTLSVLSKVKSRSKDILEISYDQIIESSTNVEISTINNQGNIRKSGEILKIINTGEVRSQILYPTVYNYYGSLIYGPPAVFDTIGPRQTKKYIFKAYTPGVEDGKGSWSSENVISSKVNAIIKKTDDYKTNSLIINKTNDFYTWLLSSQISGPDKVFVNNEYIYNTQGSFKPNISNGKLYLYGGDNARSSIYLDLNTKEYILIGALSNNDPIKKYRNSIGLLFNVVNLPISGWTNVENPSDVISLYVPIKDSSIITINSLLKDASVPIESDYMSLADIGSAVYNFKINGTEIIFDRFSGWASSDSGIFSSFNNSLYIITNNYSSLADVKSIPIFAGDKFLFKYAKNNALMIYDKQNKKLYLNFNILLNSNYRANRTFPKKGWVDAVYYKNIFSILMTRIEDTGSISSGSGGSGSGSGNNFSIGLGNLDFYLNDLENIFMNIKTRNLINSFNNLFKMSNLRNIDIVKILGVEQGLDGDDDIYAIVSLIGGQVFLLNKFGIFPLRLSESDFISFTFFSLSNSFYLCILGKNNYYRYFDRNMGYEVGQISSLYPSKIINTRNADKIFYQIMSDGAIIKTDSNDSGWQHTGIGRIVLNHQVYNNLIFQGFEDDTLLFVEKINSVFSLVKLSKVARPIGQNIPNDIFINVIDDFSRFGLTESEINNIKDILLVGEFVFLLFKDGNLKYIRYLRDNTVRMIDNKITKISYYLSQNIAYYNSDTFQVKNFNIISQTSDTLFNNIRLMEKNLVVRVVPGSSINGEIIDQFLNSGSSGTSGSGIGTNNVDLFLNGVWNNKYYINGQETTLDQNGSGTWNGQNYTNGILDS